MRTRPRRLFRPQTPGGGGGGEEEEESGSKMIYDVNSPLFRSFLSQKGGASDKRYLSPHPSASSQNSPFARIPSGAQALNPGRPGCLENKQQELERGLHCAAPAVHLLSASSFHSLLFSTVLLSRLHLLQPPPHPSPAPPCAALRPPPAPVQRVEAVVLLEGGEMEGGRRETSTEAQFMDFSQAGFPMFTGPICGLRLAFRLAYAPNLLAAATIASARKHGCTRRKKLKVAHAAMAPACVTRRRSKRARPNNGVLPTEMLFEILLRLPTIKDLSRLRLVCRAWRDLLTSDPAFARAHPSVRRLVAAGVCKLRGEIKFVDVLSGEVAKRMPVHEARVRYGHNVTTQAGHVCVQAGSVGPCVVAAVATGAATVLPAGVPVKHSAGDRIVSSTSLLGRAPSTGDYKVLRTHLCFGVVGPTSFYYHTCDVTTLGGARGDGRWRVRPDPPMRISGDFERRVVVNGIAYFLSDPYNCSTTDGSSRAIASFDMATEEWRPPMLPGPLSSLQSTHDEWWRVAPSVRDCKPAARGHTRNTGANRRWFGSGACSDDVKA
nr:unnamed protein product [Digitaria exilis]